MKANKAERYQFAIYFLPVDARYTRLEILIHGYDVMISKWRDTSAVFELDSL